MVLDENGFKLWLTARFDALDKQLETLKVALDKLEQRMIVCREHCDSTCGELFDRVEDLERADAATRAERGVTREWEARIKHLEDGKIQQDQSYWIMITALVTGAVGVISLLTAILTHKVH